jgi:GT2 family glycosyltransferase
LRARRAQSLRPDSLSTGESAVRVVRFDDAAVPGLVSVVIPTYNRARTIARAVESALAQTYASVEVVVADDGSSDDTGSVLADLGPRVRHVRQANAGVSAARNFGMHHARGEFIAFLDSDDSWLPWKIEAEVNALARHPEAGVVWTDMRAVDDAGHVIADRYLRVMYAAYGRIDIAATLPQVDTLAAITKHAPEELGDAPVRVGALFSAIMLGNLLHTSTVLFRRTRVDRSGGFDESFARTGEDYEFYVRLCSGGPVAFVDAPSTLYRVGAADQLTQPSMMLEIARNNLRTVEKWLPHTAPQLTLPRAVIRRRIADSFGWVGEAELDAGHRAAGARRLLQSLRAMPRVDRRAALLLRCALPAALTNVLRSVRRVLTVSSASSPLL